MFRITTVLILISILSLGCSEKKHSSETTARPELNSSAINSDGCLNIEKLFGILNDPRFQPMTKKTTTDLEIHSSVQPRKNFISILTLSLFDHNISRHEALNEFSDLQQEGCDTIKSSSSSELDASEVTPIKVVNSSYNKISWTSDEIRYAFEFVPPSTLKVSYSYPTYDYNCSLKENKINVHYTETIHFQINGSPLPSTETLSADMAKALAELPIESPVLSKIRGHLSSGLQPIELNHEELTQLTDTSIPTSLMECRPGAISDDDSNTTPSEDDEDTDDLTDIPDDPSDSESTDENIDQPALEN